MAGGAASTATSAAATIVLVLEWLLITGRVLPLGIGSHAAGKGFPRLSWGRPNRSLRRERAGGAITVGSGEGLPACSWPVHEGSPSTASRWSRSEARRLSACKAAWLRLGLVPDPRQMAARNLVRRSQGWSLGGAPNAEGIHRHESRPGVDLAAVKEERARGAGSCPARCAPVVTREEVPTQSYWRAASSTGRATDS